MGPVRLLFKLILWLLDSLSHLSFSWLSSASEEVVKGEEGAAPVLTADGSCREWKKTLWRGGQMLVSQEPAVATCRRWRELTWATEERSGKSCGSSGGGRESFVGGWLGHSLGRTQSPAAGLHGMWPLLSLSFSFLLGRGDNQL